MFCGFQFNVIMQLWLYCNSITCAGSSKQSWMFSSGLSVIRVASRTVGWASHPTTCRLWSASSRWLADGWASWLSSTCTTQPLITCKYAPVDGKSTFRVQGQSFHKTLLEVALLACWVFFRIHQQLVFLEDWMGKIFPWSWSADGRSAWPLGCFCTLKTIVVPLEIPLMDLNKDYFHEWHTWLIPLGAAALAPGRGFSNRVDCLMALRHGSSWANAQELRLEWSGAGAMCSHFRSYLRITSESVLIFFLWRSQLAVRAVGWGRGLRIRFRAVRWQG